MESRIKTAKPHTVVDEATSSFSWDSSPRPLPKCSQEEIKCSDYGCRCVMNDSDDRRESEKRTDWGQPVAGRFLDTVSDPPGHRSGDENPKSSKGVRPFLGIQFRCCRTYGRIYRNDTKSAYRGCCPRCGARVEVPIRGDGGSSRFFSAG